MTDGEESGEAFRDKFLLPALIEADKVIVDLDDAEGYGSSFLEEAFAGAMRKLNMSAEEFNRRVQLVSESDPSLCTEVAGYIAQEDERRKTR